MGLPEGFVRMIEELGFAPFDGLAHTLATTPPEVSLRLNPAKYHDPLPPLESVAWGEHGFYLPGRAGFTFDPRLHQGVYYVQDAASMFIGHVARKLAGDTPVCWLDACAAPGGKTTAVAAALPKGSVVVANEYVATRADILRENVAKWGNPHVGVLKGDTSRFRKYKGVFDIVAADVPCSGEGMMRKDAEAVGQWSPGLVESCAARQREIIANLWDALRPGGYFVYSTCTFNTVENERMVDWMRGEYGVEPVDVEADTAWGICGGVGVDYPCYRFVPGITRGEGLFMAVLKKPGNEPRQSKGSGKSAPGRMKVNIGDWIDADAAVRLQVQDSSVLMLSAAEAAAGMPEELVPKTEIAVAKGKDYVPTQALALSDALRRDAFAVMKVDRLTALTYLRGEALSPADGTPRGIVLLEYCGLPLGFVKNIGNRANNLYPDKWRIRSAIQDGALPELPF